MFFLSSVLALFCCGAGGQHTFWPSPPHAINSRLATLAVMWETWEDAEVGVQHSERGRQDVLGGQGEEVASKAE